MHESAEIPRTVSRSASAVLEEVAARRRHTIRLPQDKEWLAKHTGQPAKVLSQMAERKLLYRVGRGRYVLAPRDSFTVEQAAPVELLVDLLLGDRGSYYVGYLSALIAHRLTDLHSTTVYVAVPASAIRRAPMLPGRELHLVRLGPSRWPAEESNELERVRAFGDSKEFWWRSSFERTLVDALTRPELSGGFETAISAWARAHLERRADWLEVARIAKRLGPSAERRVAFLLKMLGVRGSSGWFDDIVGRESNVLLDRTRGVKRAKTIPRDPRTGVLVNVPPGRLEGWISAAAIG